MSCPNATSPIDINNSSISGKCDLKCDYSFKYQNSSCIATNRGDYISLSYDNNSNPPVIYNSNTYDVKEIRIYTPSLHTYNNTRTDGEMIIVHNSNSGAKPLLVCIPIQNNNSTSISAQLLKTIITTVSKSAPTNGDSTTVSTKVFNLSSLVPKKPFYSYSATEPYQPCSTNVDFIVYNLNDSALDINSDTLQILQQVISKNVYDIKKGPQLFFNEKGPSRYGSGNDDIYIDCQPVGQSEKTEAVIVEDYSSTNSNYNTSELINNPIVQIILGSLLFIILLLFIWFIMGFVRPMKGGSNISNNLNIGFSNK
jgi:carbonic anhydrase